jgi:hypothetical protein
MVTELFSWWLKKMLKITTLNFYAGIAGDRLLGPYFLPPRLTGAVYHDIPRSVLPELLQGVDLQTEIQLMLHTWWRCTNFFSCISGNFAQHVSGTLDRTKWTISMACSFPWFKSLRFSSQETCKVYCVCSRSQWWMSRACNNEHRMDLRWFVRYLEYSGELRNQCSDVQRWSSSRTPWTLSLIFRPELGIHAVEDLFSYVFFLVLGCKLTVYRFGHAFFVLPMCCVYVCVCVCVYTHTYTHTS